MNRGLRWGLALMGLVCCASMASAQELSESDKAILGAIASGESPGAVIERTGRCATGGGIFVEGSPAPVALVFLSPQNPDDCGNTFERTNPDGTVDEYKQGVGGAFVILFNPFEIISSAGSYVHWTENSRQDGSRTFNANGTLSDGSRMRLHFGVNGQGEPTLAAGRLWIEGRGYIAGQPGRK